MFKNNLSYCILFTCQITLRPVQSFSREKVTDKDTQLCVKNVSGFPLHIIPKTRRFL